MALVSLAPWRLLSWPQLLRGCELNKENGGGQGRRGPGQVVVRDGRRAQQGDAEVPGRGPGRGGEGRLRLHARLAAGGPRAVSGLREALRACELALPKSLS